MSRYVDLSEKVTATYYDEQYEEWDHHTVTVEDVLNEVCDDYTVLPSAQQRWIPVTEQETPDEDLCTGNGVQYSEDVLMTVYNKEDDETIIDYGNTVDGMWYSRTTDCHIPPWWKVIAWMPLPEPWREQDETN